MNFDGKQGAIELKADVYNFLKITLLIDYGLIGFIQRYQRVEIVPAAARGSGRASQARRGWLGP